MLNRETGRSSLQLQPLWQLEWVSLPCQPSFSRDQRALEPSALNKLQRAHRMNSDLHITFSGVSTSIVERTCSPLRWSWAGPPWPPLNLPFIRHQAQTPRIFLYHTIHRLLPFSLSLLPDALLCLGGMCPKLAITQIIVMPTSAAALVACFSLLEKMSELSCLNCPRTLLPSTSRVPSPSLPPTSVFTRIPLLALSASTILYNTQRQLGYQKCA